MRLVDLKPRWLEHAGQRVAIMFLCPHCVAAGKPELWLTCFFVPAGDLPDPGEHAIESLAWSTAARVMFYEALVAIGHPDPANACWSDVVGCKRAIAWQRTSDDFETMSITPSIDASESGHWHGHVTDGQIQ